MAIPPILVGSKKGVDSGRISVLFFESVCVIFDMLSFIENNRVKVLAAVQAAMVSTPFASKWLSQISDNRSAHKVP